MFKNAKVGDSVWSYIDGWGGIIEVNISDFPIKVKFKNGSIESFMVNGAEYYNNINPTLFWGEVKFEIPKPVNADTNTDACENCDYNEDAKIEYPLYKKSVNGNMVVKFTGLQEGEVVVTGIGGVYDIGHKSKRWFEHTNTEYWEDVKEDEINELDNEKKFKYPIYKLSKVNGAIVKFTGLTKGVVVEHSDEKFIGCVSHTWIEHTDEDIWEDVRHKKLEPTYYKWERLHINDELIETSNFVTDAYAEKYNFESNGWRKIENSKRSWEEGNNHS